jgi:general secretion pathway protein G
MLARERKAPVRGGFTLMEMLVVVAILVILAGAAVPIYMRYLDEAKVSRAKIDVKLIEEAVKAYYLKNSEYPPSLQTLTQVQADGTKPYLEPESIFDPWKRPYMYDPNGARNAGQKPDVYSEGPAIGNAAGQIGNWPQGR